MFRQIADDPILAPHGLSTAGLALSVAPIALLRSPLLLCPMVGFLRSTGRCHSGEVGQFTRSFSERTAHAVLVVELDREFERLVALRAGWRGMLATDLHEAHWETQGVADEAVAADQLDPCMATMVAGELNGFDVGAAHLNRLVVLVLAHHTSSARR